MSHVALYPGSFDPVTNGHVDVVRQACHLVDKLIVAIGIHPGNAPLFSVEDRRTMIAEILEPIGKKLGCEIECITFDNLTVTAAQKAGASILIRGLRDGTDLDYEMQIAGMNQTLVPEVQTIFIPASATVRPITATLVRQIAGMGGDVSAFVPGPVAARLKARFSK
jgi:pantetheine-phosphate adenylyltransferase